MSPDAQSAVPILVFARVPRPGACKTRLAPRYGAIGAARIHRRLVQRTLATALAAGCGPVQLWGAPGVGHPWFYGLSRALGLSRHRQCEGDLGRRMSRALDAALAHAPAALLVGTDCAALRPEDLQIAARRLLDGGDAVLQPAEDGGYVLLGTRRPLGGLLRHVAWSSGRELGQTCRKLEAAGWRVAKLDPRWDVDRAVDVRRARRLGLI